MNRINKFYNYPKLIQWLIAVPLFISSLFAIGFWLDLTDVNPLFYFSIFLLAPFLSFTFTPFLKLIGLYEYLSPMLLVFAPRKKKYDLHNGTSFDYLFVMKGLKPGKELKNVMLKNYMMGLLEIIRRIEAGELPVTVIVKGSSYFFSERTAKRMGFEISKAGLFERFNLLINFIDLTWTYSLANGKLSFPNLKNIKTAKITGKNLVNNKAYFERVNSFLEKKLTNIK